MSRRTVLIVMAGALVVVVALAVWLTLKPPAEEESAQETEDDQRVEISNLKLEDIREMVVESPRGRLRLARDGDSWKPDHPYPVTLDATAVEDLTYSFGRLYSERVLEADPADLAVYGLDPPVATARTTLSDGTTRVFFLGNRTPARNTFYLRADGNPTVYAVWMNHGEHFQWVLDDIRKRDLPVVDGQQIKLFQLTRRGAPDIEIIRMAEKDEQEVRFNLGLYNMRKPYSEAYGVDIEDFNELIGTIPAFKIEEFVDDQPQDLGRYGLAPPAAELFMQDDQNVVHLRFGKPKDDKLVYFQVAGQKGVYTLRGDSLDFLTVSPFTLIDKFAFIVNIDDVEEVTVESPQTRIALSMTRKGEGENVETTYFADGQEVKEDPFKKLYQSFIGLFIEAENPTPRRARPDIRMRYRMNKGRVRDWTIEYAPYDVDFYEVYVNGKTEFLMSREQLRNMMADIVKFRRENIGG